MAQIKEKSITDAVIKIDSLEDEALNKLAETYTLAQEEFLGYIVSSVLEYDNEEMIDYLIYYFYTFMEAFSIQGVQLKKIDNDMIDDFQEGYIEVLDEYMETDDEDLISSFCNQPIMLSFLINEIQTEDEEGQMLSDEIASHLFIVGIAMIALFNRAIIKE